MTIPKWGAEIDYNLFTGSEADRLKYAAQGCDAHSLSGDPLFVNATAGDFRVQPGSPALKLGFVNFPMDQFGVQSPRLKALARTPVIPAVTTIAGGHPAPAAQTVWLGATIRELIGEEYSVVGVRAGSRGILLVNVPANTAAFADGLRTGDFITHLNGREIQGVDDFFLMTMSEGVDAQKAEFTLLRNQQPMVREVNF
jgi:membrane-associated protease RseP (regulator of RpoE activity)